MHEWLTVVAESAIVLINFLALLIVLLGTVEAFISGVHLRFRSGSAEELRQVWLRYGRWLVAGLTFQLAGDIIETSITTDWQAVARLAAIALVRTFLNYFLGRDLVEVQERQRRGGE